MKKYLIIASILILVSCRNSDLKTQSISNGFIKEAGLYNIHNSKKQHRNIIMKEFNDGTLIFAIRDSKNKILFQQNLNESFSKFHYWSLYVDDDLIFGGIILITDQP
ncbi:hypothetical protein [Flavobacterium sp. 3HN19-14]|uniref:hypothetical protein n=1 Tax=Flavobacterium sp. 3HN19-14 TaxID=3448133 RepID=UPI003EE28276